MNIKTYRAKTMREALDIVRRDLGPDAAVLHTREVQNRRLFGLLQGGREIEVTASVDVSVPSRLPPSDRADSSRADSGQHYSDGDHDPSNGNSQQHQQQSQHPDRLDLVSTDEPLPHTDLTGSYPTSNAEPPVTYSAPEQHYPADPSHYPTERGQHPPAVEQEPQGPTAINWREHYQAPATGGYQETAPDRHPTSTQRQAQAPSHAPRDSQQQYQQPQPRSLGMQPVDASPTHSGHPAHSSVNRLGPNIQAPFGQSVQNESPSFNSLEAAGSLDPNEAIRLRQLADRISIANSQVDNLPNRVTQPDGTMQSDGAVRPSRPGPANQNLQNQITELHSMLEDLCQRNLTNSGQQSGELPDMLFRVFTELIDADLSEEVARELVERVRTEATDLELSDSGLIKNRIARMIESQLPIGGPIQVRPGERRVVALVGPTGVGKTTTIAKLAAHYRLKERRKVGFITVDTYRIAAVEQLRTYAEIIDLPMEVVSTPREMREAVQRLSDQELILIDTAGRSPHDDIRIQELKALLNEAGVDETHLVLSSVAGPRTLTRTAQRFATVGTTGLILTKLDEATGLGNLFPLIRNSGLALHYLTMGQNVPDDIEAASATRLARMLLGVESPVRGR